MNNNQRAAAYARQNGQASPSQYTREGLEEMTVKELRTLGSFPARHKKDQIIKEILESDAGDVDLSRLTPAQQKRLRLKGNRAA